MPHMSGKRDELMICGNSETILKHFEVVYESFGQEICKGCLRCTAATTERLSTPLGMKWKYST